MENLSGWIITHTLIGSGKLQSNFKMKQTWIGTSSLKLAANGISPEEVRAGIERRIGMLQFVSKTAGRLLAGDNTRQTADALCLGPIGFIHGNRLLKRRTAKAVPRAHAHALRRYCPERDRIEVKE